LYSYVKILWNIKVKDSITHAFWEDILWYNVKYKELEVPQNKHHTFTHILLLLLLYSIFVINNKIWYSTYRYLLIKKDMLFSFLEKQKTDSKRKKLIQTMIRALNVSEDQKSLYLDAVEVLKWEDLENLYRKLTSFVEQIELKELETIKKQDFALVAGLRKKEAEEKVREVNSFSFLLNNL